MRDSLVLRDSRVEMSRVIVDLRGQQIDPIAHRRIWPKGARFGQNRGRIVKVVLFQVQLGELEKRGGKLGKLGMSSTQGRKQINCPVAAANSEIESRKIPLRKRAPRLR